MGFLIWLAVTLTAARFNQSASVKPQDPERHSIAGISHIAPFVERLTLFVGYQVKFEMSAEEGERLWLLKTDGEMNIGTVLDLREHPGREVVAREFFASRGIKSDTDKPCGEKDDPDSKQFMAWELEEGADVLTLATEALRQIFQVVDEPLDIKNEEKDDYPEEWFPPAYGEPLERPPSMG